MTGKLITQCPPELIAAVDRVAGGNRSAFVREALEEKLARLELANQSLVDLMKAWRNVPIEPDNSPVPPPRIA